MGEVTLDLARGRLEASNGEVVDLRPQAFAVLGHLASNPGRLVSKEELFAAVWPDVVVTDDSLVQAVGDARRALGSAGRDFIRTVPRRGYMFMAPAGLDATRLASTTLEVPSGGNASETLPQAGRLPRRHLAIAWAALAGVVALVTALAWWQRPAPSHGHILSVRPFQSVSMSGEHTWIGDALSIGIASSLARLSTLPVLLDKAALGGTGESKLGSGAVLPTHVLSGSVQSDDRHVRITIDLTEANSGRLLWSERYDRSVEKLFELQDEITANTVTALQIKLVEGEQARNRTHPRGNLKAWELATLGYLRFETGGRAPLAEARQLFEQALALDPDYAWARAYLAATCFLEARFRFAPDPGLSMQRALEEASRAVATDPGLPDAHSTLGGVQLAFRHFDQAVAAGRRAVALGPNDAEIHAVLAQTMLAVGNWQEAVDLSRKAIDLTSRPPSWYYVPQAFGLVYLGRPTEAVAAGESMAALAESPFQRRAAQVAIIFADVEAGHMDEARRIVSDLKVAPVSRGAAASAEALLFKNPQDAERLRSALERAGMPH